MEWCSRKEVLKGFLGCISQEDLNAYHLQGKAGGKLYADFEDDRKQGDFSALPELHSVLSGMKVGTCISS